MSIKFEPQQQHESKCRKRIALVTGSTTGIGANIAVDLASEGYTVILTGRDIQGLKKIVRQCNEVSGSNGPNTESVAFTADLFNFDEVDKLIEFVRLKFQRLDVLVNNACWRGSTKSLLTDDTGDDLAKVIHTNVLVPMYLIQKCLIPLKPNGIDKAVVVNISSSASQVVVPLHSYSISKACLSEMSKQVALMSQSLGILSVTVSPGPVLTNERPHHSAMKSLTLVNRVGETQEISDLVIFAIKKAHLFNGKELNIDGGYIAKQKQ